MKPDPVARAAALLSGRTTTDLISMWYQTDRIMETMRGPQIEATHAAYRDITTARGWLLDELERRDPDAFAAWMDGDNDDPAAFYC